MEPLAEPEENMNPCLIHGGEVVLPEGIQPANILVQNGKILDILPSSTKPNSASAIDATGLVVLPGVIDGHTHFFQQDPLAGKFDEAADEGFTNGGYGAAAGGVTCIIEMPQAIPPTLNQESMRKKRLLSEQEAIVDFALWGGIVANQAEGDILDQIRAGAAGFKAFLCNDDPDFPALDDHQLKAALELLKGTGLMLALHCENDAINRRETERLMKLGKSDPLSYAASRPVISEAEAIDRVIFSPSGPEAGLM